MNKKPALSDHTVGALMAATAALFWGVVPIALKYVLTACHVETIIWFRFTVSFLFLTAFYLVRAPQAFNILKRPPLLVLLAGTALASNYFGHTNGVNLTSPSNAQVLVQLAPLMLAAVGVLYFKERLSRRQKAGFGLAIIGFAFFYRDQITSLVTSPSVHLHGDAWLGFAAIAWVIFASAQKIIVRSWTPQQANLLIFGTAAMVFLPMAHFSDLAGLDSVQWAMLGFLGINTLVSYGALAVALKLIPANHVSVVVSLNPLITMAAMYFLSFMDLAWLAPEGITVWGYLGAVVMIIGVVFVVMRSGPPDPGGVGGKIRPEHQKHT